MATWSKTPVSCRKVKRRTPAKVAIIVTFSDIELVLGIVGSTIGAVICILFPVSLFIQQVSSNTAEKLVAQVGSQNNKLFDPQRKY